MPYTLAIEQAAKKEWGKLDSTVRERFVKKLKKVLENPRIPSAALHGMPHHYKIQLKDSGYRLVYRVHDDILTVVIVSVGRREADQAYKKAENRH